MKGTTSEIWVTSAGSKEDVKKCLVLARSVKRSLSGRPFAVFTSPTLESHERDLLSEAFDIMFLLDDSELKTDSSISPSATFDTLAKLSVLKLHLFEKCVYLAPNSIVLRNADDIFNFGGDDLNVGLILKENTAHISDDDDSTSLSIFGVRPDLGAYRSIRKGLAEKGCLREEMKKYFLVEGRVGYLDEMFCEMTNPATCSKPNSHVAIVTFAQDPCALIGIDLGILGNLAVQTWLKTYAELDTPRNTASLSIQPALVDYSREPIAIVGMSCRYPGSNNLEDFWKVLVEGQNCIRLPPSFRFPGMNADKWTLPGGYLDIPLDEFDYHFFGISPKEAVHIDPQHRLLHEVMWEALEDAAIDPAKLHSTNGGVFVGTWTNDFKNILTNSGYTEFYRKYMGNSIGAGAARISFNLGLTGPCIATESGCSASMVAVHMACESLQHHKTNMALACGANLILDPLGQNDLPIMLAPDGKCKTLDRNTDGFGRAEGVGVVVLKRLSDAVRDNDRIWALIRGSAIAQEGVSKSMGTPTEHCESLAMSQALKEAGVLPEQVSYVEMHGTGTPTGDPIEIKSIAKAYYSERRKQPLIIGSVKTNVGHTESTSGMVGLMKVALQMKHGVIAPHINLQELSPAFDLSTIPAKVPIVAQEWRTEVDGLRRIAGVSSFGLTGTDAHLIMEEAPQMGDKFVTDFKRPWHILKISAKSEEALQLLRDRYLDYFKKNSLDDSLENMCYTGNVGRADFPYRSCVIGKTSQEMIFNLENNFPGEKKVPEEQQKICFLFTGLGSETPGMGKDLYDSSPEFRIHFDYCAKILETQFNLNLAEVLWSSEKNSNQNAKKSEICTHAGIFVVQYALFKLWESWGIKPNYCLGHSMGEFVASVCAGILSVEDALRLLLLRSQLTEEHCPPGKMLVVRAEQLVVEDKIREFVGTDSSKILDLAAFNSPEQTVVAGDPAAILEFSDYLKSEDIDSKLLDGRYGVHSRQMNAVRDDTWQSIASPSTAKMTDSSNWKCGFISSVTGDLIKEATEIGTSYWLDNLRKPVNFIGASKTASQLGIPIFLEIGPQPVLSVFQMMNSRNTDEIICLPSLKKNEEDWKTMLESLRFLYTSGVNVNWLDFDHLYDRRKVTQFPTYPFIRKSIWPENPDKFKGNKSLHPLLGNLIPNPTSTNVFQVGLNLSDLELEYVNDHRIGENVVYPGACFLETMLAAGVAILDGGNKSQHLMNDRKIPFELENMTVNSPLCLHKGTTTHVQVVTGVGDDDDKNGEISVKILGRGNDSGENEEGSSSNIWHNNHAQGSIVAFLANHEEVTVDVDLDQFEKTKQSEAADDALIEKFYTRFEELGLQFGGSFKNLERVWRDEESNNFLVKVKPPPTQNENYIIHPVILDAMFQAIIMFSYGESLRAIHVPVGIGRFVYFPRENVNKSEEMYIQVLDTHSAILLTSTGIPVAIMSQAEFMETIVGILGTRAKPAKPT